MNYFLHDYLIEDLCSSCSGDSFYKNIILYCSFENEVDDDNFEKFGICVGNPRGIMHNYSSILQTLKAETAFTFFHPEKVIVFDQYNEKDIISAIKSVLFLCKANTKEAVRSEVLLRFSAID